MRASGLQLPGGKGRQVLWSILRRLCGPSVNRLQLWSCGMRRRRSDEYGAIGIEAAEMKTAAEASELDKLLGKIRDQGRGTGLGR